MTPRVLILAVASAVSAGCADPIEAPKCEEQSLAVAAVNADTVTLTTGLKYVDGDTGIGNRVPWCTSVIVHYDAYLLNGTKFDSSRDIARPLVFTPGLGILIDGFEEGVIGMRVCSPRRLIVPPELGYGATELRDANGNVVIPANSTVVFDVELLEMHGQIFMPCGPPSA